MPTWLVALLPSLKDILKTSAKWLWGYAKKFLNEMWLNKWVLVVAGTCVSLWLYYTNLINSWFGFPPLLNIALHGIFHLLNLVWVVSHWQRVPILDDKDSGSSSQVSTGN